MSHDLWTPQSSDDDRRPFTAFDGGPGPEPEEEWTYADSRRVGFIFAVLLILLGLGIMLLGWKG